MFEKTVSDKMFLSGIVLLTFIAAGLRIYGLAATPPTSDDFGVVASAFDFMKKGHYGTAMWQHPKLRDILTYVSMTSFDGGVWGVKAVSITLGTFSIPVLGLLTKRLFSSNGIALLAAFFMAVDSVHIDFSRQAIQEVHMPFFYLLGILAAVSSGTKRNPLLLTLSGLLFGLGIAGKWYVVFPLAVTFSSLAFQSFKESGMSSREKGGELSLLFSTLVVLPVTVYLLTYLPWFLHRGYDISDWLTAQKFMVNENLAHQGFNDYLMENSSYPALWFLKPVSWVDFNVADNIPVVWIAISNPLVWMLTLPSSLFLLYKGIKEKVWSHLFLSALFWSSYLPLALARRPIWVNTSFAVTPFVFMIVAYCVATWFRSAKYRTHFLFLYVGAVILASVPLYLLATGRGFDNPLFHPITELFRPMNER